MAVAPARACEALAEPVADVPDVPSEVPRAEQDFSLGDDRPADSRSDRRHQRVAQACAGPEPHLPERVGVDVVEHKRGNSEAFSEGRAESRPCPAGHEVGGGGNRARRTVDDSGAGRCDAGQRAARLPGDLAGQLERRLQNRRAPAVRPGGSGRPMADGRLTWSADSRRYLRASDVENEAPSLSRRPRLPLGRRLRRTAHRASIPAATSTFRTASTFPPSSARTGRGIWLVSNTPKS